MKQYKVRERRLGALERLESAKFFPKKNKKGQERSEKTWEENRQAQIETLKKRVNFA